MNASDPAQFKTSGADQVGANVAGADATGANAAPADPRKRVKSGMNWFRFWMQMLAAMIIFNIVAGLVTWYYIFPRLHPAQ